MIEHHGLRIVIEGKVGDSPIAQVEAWNDAQKRLRNGVYDAALAVVYPPELRSSAYDRLLQQRH
ncbi:MAG: hypothetical protein DRP63_06560 [Planctomycetota bacterium]|nr:MAG: hypothetical protein DRP63_06560 [Planctomycetota bacterium]